MNVFYVNEQRDEHVHYANYILYYVNYIFALTATLNGKSNTLGL
jgi:hypothetical protein